MAPLVHQQRGRLGVRGLDPVGEQVPLVGLVPDVLVEVRVGDLLKRLNLVNRNEVRVEIHKLDANLLERALREQVSLDPRKRLVRVIERLLDQAQLLALRLVKSRRHRVILLEPLEREDEELPVVLVRERRERDWGELAGLEPVHRGGVDGDSLLGGDVRSILEVVVLPLLLRLEPQPGEPTQVLAAHSLVHGGAAANALAVVVRHVGPPVSLGLDVTQNHILDRRREPGDFPRDVSLPAPPRLGEVLQDRLSLVRLDPFRHHVQDVVHHGGAKLEVEVRLDPLLRHRLRHALRVPALKLPGQQVPEPTLQEGHDAAEEEEPDAPHGRPEPHAGAFAHRTGVEPVVDEVLEVLAHANLSHEPVLVAVHTGELADVREDVLQPVRELERVHVAQPELHVRVHHQLRET